MLRRFLITLLASILMILTVPFSASETVQAGSVRVLLGTGGAEKIEIAVKGDYSVGGTLFTGGTLTASISNGTISVTHAEKGMLAASKTSVRVERAEADRDSTNLTLTNTGHNAKLVYLGDLILNNADGTMEVINDVGMREYLYGVVSGELTNSSDPEILKVGTICAKGFALAETEARRSKSFDVYDTTKSQLYYGYKAEDANVIRAVDEVWENTLLYQGKIVKTYYCTANGGQAVTPKIHWGGSSGDGAYYYGYDPYDLAQNSKNVIVGIDGKDPSKISKKVYSYFVSLAEAALKEKVDKIERITAVTGVYDPKNPAGTDRYPLDLAPHAENTVVMTVRTKEGTVREAVCAFTLPDLNSKASLKASGKILFSVRTGASEWKLVYGISSGHQVGLSHRGAARMVKEGYSYADILKFYYRGADLIGKDGNVIPARTDFESEYTGPDPELPPIGPSEPEPTETPEPEPTETPKPEPTETPEPEPTETPEPEPTETPEPEPTETPESKPTETPEPEPTETPEPKPTETPEPEPAETPEPPVEGLGDVDGKNGITRADALLVVRYLVGLEELTDDQLMRADLDRDGRVSVMDASAILRACRH